MTIQAVGAAVYFTGRALSAAKASLAVCWLNVALAAFMPSSMAAGVLSVTFFAQGGIAPYPFGGPWQMGLFAILYTTICAASFLGLKKHRQ